MEQAAGQGGRHSHSPHLLRTTGSAVLVSYIKKTLQIETSLRMMFSCGAELLFPAFFQVTRALV